MTIPVQNQRIEIVDALRGFALIGIILLHSVQHFGFFWAADMNPDFFKPIDPYISKALDFLILGKAFPVFSLMFGLSFFIQMEKNRKKGIDFRRTYIWRLSVLFIFGFLFSLILIGEILTIYAILGMPLIFLFKMKKKILLWLIVIFLLQIPTIILLFNSYMNPEMVIDKSMIGVLWGEAFHTFGEGAFADVIKFNLWKGHKAILLWAYYQGNLLQTFGLFLVGLFLGKVHFFENIDSHKKVIHRALFGFILLFALLNMFYLLLPKSEMSVLKLDLYNILIETYINLAFSASVMLLFITVYQNVKSKIRFSFFTAFGRMSLTNYVLHPLIGVPLFYGFGFGLYRYFGATLSLFFGILFLIGQIYLSKYWLRHYNFGPLEWGWRVLTYFSFKSKNKIART